MTKPVTVLAVCAIVSIGCSGVSNYTPNDPGRIYFVQTPSGRTLEKDGKLYSTSPFRSSLSEAVAGEPAAEEHAQQYRRQTWSTGGLVVLGIACLVPTGALLSTDSPSTGQRVATVGLSAVGMTALIVALVTPQFYRHHLYDAVNIYNDNVASRKRDGFSLGEASIAGDRNAAATGVVPP